MANLKLKSVRALQIREAFQRIYTAENTEEFEGQYNDQKTKNNNTTTKRQRTTI